MVDARYIVDGIELTDRTDFADLAHRALLGSVGGSLRSDCFPLDWVFRVHRELAGSPLAELRRWSGRRGYRMRRSGGRGQR